MSIKSLLSAAFNRPPMTDDNIARVYRSHPVNVDLSESIDVNSRFTESLYNNREPGFKLVGGLANVQISKPVRFMGTPIPIIKSGSSKYKELLKDFIGDKINECEEINTRVLRDGGVWVWPSYDAETDTIIWEKIPGDHIGTIFKDITTKIINKIIIEEILTVTIGVSEKGTVRRTRTFTKDTVVEEYSGNQDRKVVYKNILGILPIPFLNDASSGNYSGHSEFEKTVYDLKGYHDIDKTYTELISKFRPKMVLNTNNPTTWLQNNGIVNPDDFYDISKVDLIVNSMQEKVDFIFPENMSDSYVNERKLKFHKFIEESGTPEIFWGLKTEGNNASVDEQVLAMVGQIQGKRNFVEKSYEKLFTASLKLFKIVHMIGSDFKLEIQWNKLDGLGEEVRSNIFEKYCDGISKAANIGCMSDKQIYEIWKMLYPDTIESFAEFKKGVLERGRELQWLRADYEAVREDGSLIGEETTTKTPTEEKKEQ